MKKICCIVVLISLSLACLAQRQIDADAPHTLKERGYLGGGFGLNGGTGYFYVALNPIGGYMVTPKLSAGLGLNWSMTTYTNSTPSQSFSQYGVSPFLRYNFDQLFMYAEYNYLSTNVAGSTERKFVDRLLLGLGYSQPLGGRSTVNVVGLYDVLYKAGTSYFASPWVIRVYFTF